jgi:hypothetical protein
MASDAPDYQRVVVLVASGLLDAPDWEEVVVGPGGTPIGSALKINSSGLGGLANIAPGASISQSFTPPLGGTSIGFMVVSLTTPTTSGTYLVRARPYIVGSGVMYYSYNYVTGSIYVPVGAAAGLDLTLIVPWTVIGGVASTDTYGVTVYNDATSPDVVKYGSSAQAGVAYLCGAEMVGT